MKNKDFEAIIGEYNDKLETENNVIFFGLFIDMDDTDHGAIIVRPMDKALPEIHQLAIISRTMMEAATPDALKSLLADSIEELAKVCVRQHRSND